jgi:hypothetical protein
MKHPVLHVKKGAPVYDDSREEREAPRRAAEPVSRFRFRAGKRRRRGGLTFLPLLVLALALVFVFRFIPGKPLNHAVLAGWQAVLRAAPRDGVLLVGVTFIRTRPPAAPGSAAANTAPEPAPIARVSFYCPATGEKQAATEPLVRSPFTIHARMVNGAAVRSVQAEVIIGDQKRFLSVVPGAR